MQSIDDRGFGRWCEQAGGSNKWSRSGNDRLMRVVDLADLDDAGARHGLSVTFHCLSLPFHCLSVTCHCLSCACHCFPLPFTVDLSLPFLGLSLPFIRREELWTPIRSKQRP